MPWGVWATIAGENHVRRLTGNDMYMYMYGCMYMYECMYVCVCGDVYVYHTTV